MFPPTASAAPELPDLTRALSPCHLSVLGEGPSEARGPCDDWLLTLLIVAVIVSVWG